MKKYFICPICNKESECEHSFECSYCNKIFLEDDINYIWQIRSGHEWYLTNMSDIVCRHCGEVVNSGMEAEIKDNDVECKFYLKEDKTEIETDEFLMTTLHYGLSKGGWNKGDGHTWIFDKGNERKVRSIIVNNFSKLLDKLFIENGVEIT